MRHPDAQENIINELKRVFPGTSDELPLNFDTLQSHILPYTMAAFNETLRLYPPVPVELKECTAETTFPDGTWLPKGSVLMWAPWSMGRSKHIWGEDADLFRPERWITREADSSFSMISKTAFEFPVFNGGPRSCLGKRMAELLAVYVIANLLWRYRFEEVKQKGGDERVSQNSLTLPMQDGLPCRVSKR